MRALRAILGIAALAALAILLWFASRPPPLTVQGEVSADRVDVSPRVSGRIVKLGADVGSTVERGAVIAELENPQLLATLAAARASLAVARADLARVNSTRPENIATRRAEVAAARADVTLYQEAYGRQAQLARSGNTAQARVDEATETWKPRPGSAKQPKRRSSSPPPAPVPRRRRWPPPRWRRRKPCCTSARSMWPNWSFAPRFRPR